MRDPGKKTFKDIKFTWFTIEPWFQKTFTYFNIEFVLTERPTLHDILNIDYSALKGILQVFYLRATYFVTFQLSCLMGHPVVTFTNTSFIHFIWFLHYCTLLYIIVHYCTLLYIIVH